MKRTKKLLLLIILIVFALILSDYINFRMIRVDNYYENQFKDRLVTVIKKDSSFYIKDLTSFDWDKAFIIMPYTSKTEMQKIISKKWTTSNTYIGYLLEKTIFGEHPLDDDIFHKLVFVNGERIVLDITIKRSIADFREIKGLIFFDDLLAVSKKEYGYPTISRLESRDR